MTSTAISENGIPIRLTDERWGHITEEHGEVAGLKSENLNTISEPPRIAAGTAGELSAMREIELGKWLIVVYRESESDGFVIASFLTRRTASLDRRKQLWP